ncbi:MAG: hypothetical protein A2293_11030 [Elusimicrobia bacterium RIFOXYB2_FULL_49_7]|nr:MAG: hypothetical protein A2293_11030 [Elusimicrobia bacterium RIFOXYB2_FULL_49_7]
MKAATLCVLLVVLFASQAFSTNSRVESMGKSSDFFMDDVGIFENPANINIYPNFLIGEMGRMVEFSDSNTNYKNQDPSHPYGGGILAFSLNKDKEAETRYPMICVGAMMNRQNELVDVLENAAVANGHIIPDPVVPNSDFFLGYTMANGIMLGGHMYAAMQSVTVPGSKMLASQAKLESVGITTGTVAGDTGVFNHYSSQRDLEWSSTVVKGDLGINMPLTQNIDMELSFGLGLLSYTGNEDTARLGAFSIPTYDDNDLSFFVNARWFSSLASLNGEIVPVVKFKRISVRDYQVREITGGLGANITLDRGFFWAGTEFIHNKTTSPVGNNKTKEETCVSIPLSFGIERNIVWDWFVMRVGFKKVLYGSQTDQNEMSMLETNPEADMTAADHVGFGVGLNIEEKLKIDGVVAEDIPYKWGNLISGNSHHILTAITATYSF